MAKLTDKQELAESILDNFNTVGAVFVDSNYEAQEPKVYTFKVPKSWKLEASSNCRSRYDKADKVPGSLLVVKASGNFTVVKVVVAHKQPTNENRTKLAWAVQIIDTTEFDKLVAYDEKAIQTLTELDTRRVKRELLQEFARDLSTEEFERVRRDLNLGDDFLKLAGQKVPKEQQ